MTADEAIKQAVRARPDFDVPHTYQAVDAEKRIIELVEPIRPVRDEMPKPGKTRDVVAWVVTLEHEAAKVWFAVHDDNGEIVRFRKSRNAALRMRERETGT